MVNKTLELLREVEGKGEMSFEPFLNLHILMQITEEEIDTYFKYFMEECNVEGNEIAKIYWKYLHILKKHLLNLQVHDKNNQQFSEELKKNSLSKKPISVFHHTLLARYRKKRTNNPPPLLTTPP